MQKISKKLFGSAVKSTTGGLRLKKPPAHPERDLQASLVTYFATVVKPGDAILFAVPNGEIREKVIAGILTGGQRDKYAPDETYLIPGGQGVLPGMTDLVLASAGGVTTYIEVKVPEQPATIISKKRRAGTLSKPQIIIRDALIKLSHNHEVVYSIDDFDAILRKRGIAVKALRFPIMIGKDVFRPRSDRF